MTLETYPVLDIMPDFAEVPKPKLARTVQASSDVGRWAAQWTGQSALHIFNHSFVMNAEEANNLLEFFNSRAGKKQPFFVPSWHQDIVASAGVANGNTELEISAPSNYSARLLGATNLSSYFGRFVFLFNEAGDLHVSRVAGVDGSPQVITLVEPTAADFVLGAFFAGYLHFVRFANDELEIELRNGVYSANVAMQELVRTSEELS